MAETNAMAETNPSPVVIGVLADNTLPAEADKRLQGIGDQMQTPISKHVRLRRVCLQMAGLLLFAIVVALIWQAIGAPGEEVDPYYSYEEVGWQTVFGFGQSDYQSGSAFWAALHWSISHFTFTSMEVVPTNGGERLYANIVAFASIFFAYPLLFKIVYNMCQLWPLPQSCSKMLLLGRIVALVLLLIVEITIIGAIFGATGDPDKGWSFDQSSNAQHQAKVHWAVAQFSLASMEIVPRTDGGRLYSILVQLIGIVTIYPQIAGLVICLCKLSPWGFDV